VPKSKQHRRSGTGEVIPPLSVSERILDLLKVQQKTFPPKELDQDEIERWVRDLEPFQIAAIEWSFDNWRRNGRFFPVPADILDQCISWNPPELERKGCNAECRRRHHQGYGETDVIKLWKLAEAKRMELGRALTDADYDELMTVLDKWRGKPPAWRATA
jgi:hypothetical protein